MTRLEMIIGTLVVASVLNADNNADAEEQKQRPRVSWSASAGTVDKCMLLSGKRQGEQAMFQGSASVNVGPFGASSSMTN